MSGRLWVAAVVVGGMVLGMPARVEAQLGGLTKRARDRAAQAAGVQSTDEAARMPGPVLTAAVLDQVMTGLKAEKVARDNWAAEQARQQRLREEEQARREADANHSGCIDREMRADSNYIKADKLQREAMAAAQRGETAKAVQAAQQIQGLITLAQQNAEAKCKPSQAAAAPEEQAVAAVQVNPDSVGAKAAKMSATDYAQAKELLYTYLNFPQKAGLSADEKRVVDPKKAQIKDALKGAGLGG